MGLTPPEAGVPQGLLSGATTNARGVLVPEEVQDPVDELITGVPFRVAPAHPASGETTRMGAGTLLKQGSRPRRRPSLGGIAAMH